MSASTERRWVLMTEAGSYARSNCGEFADDMERAYKFHNLEAAVASASIRGHDEGRRGVALTLFRAVPVEREAGRKVELEHGECVKYALHREGKWWAMVEGGEVDSIRDAELFTAIDLFIARGIDDYDYWHPIPVRVTEQPGEWRVVEEDE